MIPTPATTIGIDFGTLSARALLIDARTGTEIATAVADYSHAVMDETLAASGKRLPPDWALQDPADYISTLVTTVRAVLAQPGVAPEHVVGLAIDFTASSPMPVLADGTPLAQVPGYAAEPHAYVKLWKHHAAQPQADRINAAAHATGQPWIHRYGGKYSSEWYFSKLLQILDEAPSVYDSIGRWVEAADWVVWQLTGTPTRNTCTLGYKALFQDGAYPPPDYFAALHPAFRTVVNDKVGDAPLAALGSRVGGLAPAMAAQLGLPAGIAVAAANVDAHVTAPAVRATQPGIMVMIMGTSTCHIMSGTALHNVEGMCGVVDGGIVDGLYGYEAGQNSVGDMFAWFVEHAVPPADHQAARAAGLDLHAYLEREAARQRPGEHGLLALDWWNGNRSTLVDADLTGLLVGVSIGTRAPDIYRALIEATAYGTRAIIEAFEGQGVLVEALVAAGGLPEKNALLRQIYADVTGRTLRLAGSAQAPALGSAIHAAVAAGLYQDVHAAADALGRLRDEVVTPVPAHQELYDQLYADYKTLYDDFGRHNGIMRRLKALRRAQQAADHDAAGG